MARRERYLVGLDVGTSNVCAVVGESLDDGSLDIVGIGVAESRGIKRGVVVNLEAAVDSIKKAIDEAAWRSTRFTCRCRGRTSRDSTAAA
jgi:cell division protein FtsA